MAIYKNFNYIDQLSNTVVDLTEYLESFSDDNYSLKLSNRQPVKATVRNIFERLTLVQQFKEKGGSFRTYQILENELPEDVAIKFYGSEDFWWIVTLWNEIENPLTQWPMTEEQLNYLADVFYAKENKYTRKTYYDLFFDKNESLREIEVLNSTQVQKLISIIRNSILFSDSTGNTFKIRV